MIDRLKRTIAKIVLVSFGAAAMLALPLRPAAVQAAGTPPGTAITNQASASYTDGNNNNFTTLSNTVTTTVQNAPSISITPGTTQNIVPGGQLTDTFTVTNTGNGVGTLALTFGSQSGSDSSSATVAAYELTFPTAFTGTLPTNCTAVGSTNKIFSCTTSASANSLLGSVTVASGAAVYVGVVYNVANGATTGTPTSPNTIVTPLNGTITQTAANNPGSTGSATSTALATAPVETDDVAVDARLDLSKTGYQPGATPNTSGNIEYLIRAADGGGTTVRDLASVKTLLGSSTAGVFISDKIPVFNSLPLAVQSASVTTSAANGFTGTTTTIYYTTAANASSGWTAYSSGNFPSGVTYIGVFVTGGTLGAEFTPNNGATNGGAVTTAQAALTLTLYITPPAGTGSGNQNSAVNQADSVIGGGQPNPNPDTNVTNAPQNVIGPGIAANTTDSSTAITTTGQGISYPTQAAGSSPTQPGASNTVGNNAPPSAVVLDGPYTVPGASGSYNGTVAVSTSNDFSAISFEPASGFTPTNTSATGIAGNQLGAATTINVANTIQNNGNAADNLTVALTAPTGFGVAIYAASSTGAPTGAALAGSTTATTASYTFSSVPSGAPTDTANQVSYVAVYTSPATATAFTVYDASATVTSANDNTQTNSTHNELVAGGAVALSKSSTLDGTTCPSGNAVPGCIINYTVKYTNVALPAASCPSTAPTSITSYQGGYYAKGLTIAENGKNAPNTWGATYTTTAGGTANTTTGLNAAAKDTTTGTTFTGNTVASYSFTALIGGSSTYYVAPGCSGSVTFAVTVNNQ